MWCLGVRETLVDLGNGRCGGLILWYACCAFFLSVEFGDVFFS